LFSQRFKPRSRIYFDFSQASISFSSYILSDLTFSCVSFTGKNPEVDFILSFSSEQLIFFLYFVRSNFFMHFFTGKNTEVDFILSFLKRTTHFLLIFRQIYLFHVFFYRFKPRSRFYFEFSQANIYFSSYILSDLTFSCVFLQV